MVLAPSTLAADQYRQAAHAQPTLFRVASRPTFEINRGEYDPDVKFFSRGTDHSVLLRPTEAELHMSPRGTEKNPAPIRMRFVGASPFTDILGGGRLPGNPRRPPSEESKDADEARSGFEEASYRGVFPGVDLIFCHHKSHLEYYFVVRPYARIDDVVIEYRGVQKLELDEHGDLIVRYPDGALVQPPPTLFQKVDGVRKPVEGSFLLLAGNRVGFTVKEYDLSQPLVIDPVLIYYTPEQNWGAPERRWRGF